MRFSWILALPFFVNFAVGVEPAAASTTHVGTIKVYHLNGWIPGRGVCIQMNPRVPTNDYACLYLDNNLYKEISATLLTGYATNRTCQIWWDSTDGGGYARLMAAECM